MSERYLIVGLGNPGRRYANTRHNVGFWVIDELARRHNIRVQKQERKALTGEGQIAGRRAILAMPQTYMNLSGESIRALVDFYKIPLEQVVVIHDDLDTSLGTLRLRGTGGHGGQNGIRNTIQHLGTQEFARVRIGIGRPPGRMPARDYVLQPFSGDDAITAQQVVERAADAVELWLKSGLETAMSTYNGDVTSPPPPPPPSAEEELAIALRAHELAPGDTRPLEKLAQVYRRLRDLDAAAEAYLRLAEIHAHAGRGPQQRSALEQALSVRPGLTDVQVKLARLYEAHDDSKRAVQRWLKLAEYHLRNDDAADAQAALAEALRLNPQHPKALELQKTLSERETSS